MDPASAAVAFVGFSAAIIQLAACLVKGCRTIHSLKQKLGETPQEIWRLYKSMQRLERIVSEVKDLGTDIEEHWSSSSLAVHWNDHAAEIEKDLAALDQRLSKLHSALKAKSFTSKHIRAGIRKAFMDDELERFERILSSHQETFLFMLSVVSEKRSRRILSEIRTQTKRIDSLSLRGLLVDNSITIQCHDSKLASASLDQFIYDRFAYQLESEKHSSPQESQVKDLIHREVAANRGLSLHPHEQQNHHPSAEKTHPQVSTSVDLSDTTAEPSSLSGRRSRKPRTSKYLVACTPFSWRFPLGVITGREVRQRHLADEPDWTLTATLFPLPWLTDLVVRVTIGNSSVEGFKFSQKTYSYNNEPDLIRCMNSGDLHGLRALFTSGRARPCDLVAPWGNNLLHEAVTRHATGVPNMLDICALLLSLGVDSNLQNTNGRSALLHCCQLMKKSEELSRALIPMANHMIEHGADLSLCDKEGYSACALVFESHRGINYIQDHLYRHIDLDMYDDLRTADFWLVAALARCIPTFRQRLEAQLGYFRTPETISSSKRPLQGTLPELEVADQVKWVKAASRRDRTVFMRTICAHGPTSMVEPFLACDIDLDEVPSDDTLSYICAAARGGNLDVVHALSRAGASMDQAGKATRDHQLANSVVDELLIRWQSMNAGRPPYATRRTSPSSEHWILPSLLQNPTFRGPNVLLTALYRKTELWVFSKLLEHGCGRRDGQRPASWHLHMMGSEVAEAVKLESPLLQQMVDSGLALECEDRLGCTATLHALDMGSIDCLRILIDAGANLTRRTGYGISALELAESNLQASHPRPVQRAWINKFEWQNRYFRQIGLEEDRKAYELVRRAVSNRQRGILPYLTYRGTVRAKDPRKTGGDAEGQQGYIKLVVISAVLTGTVLMLVQIWNALRFVFRNSKGRSGSSR